MASAEKPALQKLEWPDYTSRTQEGLARLFDYFGRVEAPQLDAVLYAGAVLPHRGRRRAARAGGPGVRSHSRR